MGTWKKPVLLDITVTIHNDTKIKVRNVLHFRDANQLYQYIDLIWFTCWERADLLALVGDVDYIFCYFPMWYLVSCVVLDCIFS